MVLTVLVCTCMHWVLCRRAALSLDDAEARMRDQRAADGAVPLSLVPKSIKEQAREVAEREGKVMPATYLTTSCNCARSSLPWRDAIIINGD